MAKRDVTLLGGSMSWPTGLDQVVEKLEAHGATSERLEEVCIGLQPLFVCWETGMFQPHSVETVDEEALKVAMRRLAKLRHLPHTLEYVSLNDPHKFVDPFDVYDFQMRFSGHQFYHLKHLVGQEVDEILWFGIRDIITPLTEAMPHRHKWKGLHITIWVQMIRYMYIPLGWATVGDVRSMRRMLKYIPTVSVTPPLRPKKKDRDHWYVLVA